LEIRQRQLTLAQNYDFRFASTVREFPIQFAGNQSIALEPSGVFGTNQLRMARGLGGTAGAQLRNAAFEFVSGHGNVTDALFARPIFRPIGRN
jgi:hypothetical protein